MKKPHRNHPTPCSNIHTSALTSGRCGLPPSSDENNRRKHQEQGHAQVMDTRHLMLILCAAGFLSFHSCWVWKFIVLWFWGSGALCTSCDSPDSPDSPGSPSWVAKLIPGPFACNRLADAFSAGSVPQTRTSAIDFIYWIIKGRQASREYVFWWYNWQKGACINFYCAPGQKQPVLSIPGATRLCLRRNLWLFEISAKTFNA